jgi:hypothetical protein
MFAFLNLLKNVILTIIVLLIAVCIYLYLNQNKLIYMPEGKVFIIHSPTNVYK